MSEHLDFLNDAGEEQVFLVTEALYNAIQTGGGSVSLNDVKRNLRKEGIAPARFTKIAEALVGIGLLEADDKLRNIQGTNFLNQWIGMGREQRLDGIAALASGEAQADMQSDAPPPPPAPPQAQEPESYDDTNDTILGVFDEDIQQESAADETPSWDTSAPSNFGTGFGSTPEQEQEPESYDDTNDTILGVFDEDIQQESAADETPSWDTGAPSNFGTDFGSTPEQEQKTDTPPSETIEANPEPAPGSFAAFDTSNKPKASGGSWGKPLGDIDWDAANKVIEEIGEKGDSGSSEPEQPAATTSPPKPGFTGLGNTPPQETQESDQANPGFTGFGGASQTSGGGSTWGSAPAAGGGQQPQPPQEKEEAPNKGFNADSTPTQTGHAWGGGSSSQGTSSLPLPDKPNNVWNDDAASSSSGGSKWGGDKPKPKGGFDPNQSRTSGSNWGGSKKKSSSSGGVRGWGKSKPQQKPKTRGWGPQDSTDADDTDTTASGGLVPDFYESLPGVDTDAGNLGDFLQQQSGHVGDSSNDNWSDDIPDDIDSATLTLSELRDLLNVLQEKMERLQATDDEHIEQRIKINQIIEEIKKRGS